MGLSAQLVSPSPVGTWTYGAEFYRDWVNSGQTIYNSNGTLRTISYQGPVDDDSTYDIFGLYVQNEMDITKRCKLILGGRYTYAGVYAGKGANTVALTRMSISDDWNSAVGSGRVIYQLDEKKHWHIFAGVSQGFRAPNLSDLIRFDIARTGEGEVPSPGLRPEEFITGEIGLKAQYDTFDAELSYYYTDIHDMIVRSIALPSPLQMVRFRLSSSSSRKPTSYSLALATPLAWKRAQKPSTSAACASTSALPASVSWKTRRSPSWIAVT